MQKNKYVSKLDLKFLDMKFLTIDTTDHSVNYSTRDKNNYVQFPSINHSKNQNTCLNFDQLSLIQNQDYCPPKNSKTLLKASNQSNRRNQNILSPQNLKLQSQIDKYKQKIRHLKKENQLIHSQIVNIYNQKDKHREKDVHVKRVKNIEVYESNSILREAREFHSQKRKISQKKQRFYQNLYDAPNRGYQQKLEDLKQRFISSNLHKNFEQYLLHKNKRVPEFLKRIR